MNTIKCPHCQEEIDVDSVLKNQIEEKFSEKFDKQESNFQERLASQQLANEEQLTKKLEEKFSEKAKLDIEFYKDQLSQKSNEVNQLKEQELELRRQKQALADQQKDVDLTVQRKLDAERSTIREQATKENQDEFLMKLGDKDQLINGLTSQIEQLKQRAEQGSMQIQGESQEVELENLLIRSFPIDHIKEVKKGQNGSDVIHTILDSAGREIGKISFESKRTKAFSNGWIDKLKQDMQSQGADIGIIVTQTMPTDMPDYGIKDGIWIVQFKDLRNLVSILRHSLLQIAEIKFSQQHKGDKMTKLYDFLISSEFKFQIEGIVDGFSAMKFELDREKRAMTKIWKERERQIDKVINNTINMHTSLKSIAGTAVPAIASFELLEE